MEYLRHDVLDPESALPHNPRRPDEPHLESVNIVVHVP